MAKIYSARGAGEKLGIPHLEVIRRIHKGDIRAQKLGWNWVVREDAIEEAKGSDWYKRRIQRQGSNNTAVSA